MKTIIKMIITLILIFYNNSCIELDIDVNKVLHLIDYNKYYIYYYNDNVTIYHSYNIDTNIVRLIPAGDIYLDLAYFDNKMFKIY